MSDLIKRQDAIDAIEAKEANEFGNYMEYNVAFNDGLHSAVFALEDLPSAEPERKKGQWSNYKDEHCCSVCKCVVISDCWNDEIRYDYCPYCGAQMDWSE